jgi:hypothetical protein
MTTTERVTQRPNETEAEACRRLGWAVGTRLVGDEGCGPTVIRLTAIGERHILAVIESDRGRPTRPREGMWTLSCRDWQVVT